MTARDSARPGRAVFLDRDGVLNVAVLRNGRPSAPLTVEALEFTPGASAALDRLRDSGFQLVCVTNQPDVVRGWQQREVVDAINAAVVAAFRLDDLRVCFHDDADRCTCRKPAPGMLLASAAEHGIDLGRSAMIGDRWSDVEAGRRAGCHAILLGDGYGEINASGVVPDYKARTFADAVEWILQRAS